jgi:hypothetical protein
MALYIERLKRAFLRLRQRQQESLKAATFLGMTPADWREYDAREFSLRLLAHQLRRVLRLQQRSRSLGPKTGKAKQTTEIRTKSYARDCPEHHLSCDSGSRSPRVVDINSSHAKAIRAELFRLFQLQLDALDSATFSLAGLTRAGWLEYAQRQARIRELRNELGVRLRSLDLLKMEGSRHLQ